MSSQNNVLLNPSLSFSPSCKSATANFYVCQGGSNFIGCCNTSPCDEAGCGQTALQPATFNASAYDQIHKQRCGAGSEWYTCQKTNPPFMGCCKSDPCAWGNCPSNDLTEARLSFDSKEAADFLPLSADVMASPSSSLESSSSSLTTSFSTLSSATSTIHGSKPSISILSSISTTTAANGEPSIVAVYSPETPAQSKLSLGAIAGITIGSVAILALACLLIFFIRRKTAKSRKAMEHSRAETGGDGKEARDAELMANIDAAFGTDTLQHEVAAPAYIKLGKGNKKGGFTSTHKLFLPPTHRLLRSPDSTCCYLPASSLSYFLFDEVVILNMSVPPSSSRTHVLPSPHIHLFLFRTRRSDVPKCPPDVPRRNGEVNDDE